jgi:uncharacterized phage-like protein YoqJ
MSKNVKITFLGARVQDLGGFQGNELQDNIRKNISQAIENLMKEGKNPIILTRLQLGIETWAANAAYNLGVNCHVYVPFDNPYSKWPKRSQMDYLYLLKKATKKIVVNTGDFEVRKMHDAEVKMIEDADLIFTFFVNPLPIMKFVERSGKPVTDLMPKGEQDDFYITF